MNIAHETASELNKLVDHYAAEDIVAAHGEDVWSAGHPRHDDLIFLLQRAHGCIARTAANRGMSRAAVYRRRVDVVARPVGTIF